MFLKLQKIVFTNKYENRDLLFIRIQYHFNTKQFEQCKKLIINKKNEYKEDVYLICFYIKVQYELKEKVDALQKLETLFKDKLDILSWRNLFVDKMQDEAVLLLLQKYYSDEEIKRMWQVIEEESRAIEAFIFNNQKIKKHYDNKIGTVSKI